MNKFDLKKKVAIVTGGAQGFGLDITKRFLKSGAKVIVWDNDENQLKKIVKKIKNKNLYKQMVDVTDPENVEDSVNKITKNMKIDILVNNAGITKDNLSIRLSEEDWKKVLDINLTSTFYLCKYAIKKMLKNKYGKIINITSIVGHTGNLGQSNYTASKAGIIAMSKSFFGSTVFS